MSGWLINLLITMVLKIGLPAVLDWLRKRFPDWFPVVGPILSDYVTEVKETKTAKRDAVERAKQKLRECSGIGCPPNLKVERF
jgi:hypothetical protein